MEKEIIEHLAKDKIFKKVLDTTEVRFTFDSGDMYSDLLRSIVSQQLSTKAAATIHGRFLTLFSDKYPHIDQLLKTEHETLRSVGLSNQKAGYVRNVAEFFKKEQLENKDWSVMDDESILKYLTQIKGVGKWTVEMILMFTLKRPDVFPIGDLGIVNAMKSLYELEEQGKPLLNTLSEIAENWRPYRSYACYYLWSWRDGAV